MMMARQVCVLQVLIVKWEIWVQNNVPYFSIFFQNASHNTAVPKQQMGVVMRQVGRVLPPG